MTTRLKDLSERRWFYLPRLVAAPAVAAARGRVVQVVCGMMYTLLLRDDGQVTSWGWNGYGVLGSWKMLVLPKLSHLPECV